MGGAIAGEHDDTDESIHPEAAYHVPAFPVKFETDRRSDKTYMDGPDKIESTLDTETEARWRQLRPSAAAR